jgi:hypothetical protein
VTRYGWLTILVGVALFPYYFLLNPIGLSHFDEGQYAFARVWPWIDQFDVDHSFFSPPLYPFLVGLIQQLPITRPDLAGVYVSFIACWASLFFGVKLAVAWWGRSAALPAFVLLLFSPMRIAFGTIGLTDALFTALFLTALFAATKAFHDRSTRWTIAAALLAGSTWSCKYNGFIALAVVAGLFLAQRTPGSFIRWLTICIVAASIMAPWYWAIHTHHADGLEALRKHQQGYVRGLAAIPSNLATAYELRLEFRSAITLIGAWICLGTALIWKTRWIELSATAFLLLAEAVFGGALPIAGLLLVPIAVVSARTDVRIALVLTVLATTFLPAIYTPYLRLWLPAEHLLLLVNAGAVAVLDRQGRRVPPRWLVFALLGAGLVVATIGTFFSTAFGGGRTSIQWLPPAKAGYLPAATRFAEGIKKVGCEQVLVYGRPPLLYYLAASGANVPIRRLADEPLSAWKIEKPTILIVDRIALRDAKEIGADLAEGDSNLLRLFQRFDFATFTPHPATKLDDFGRDRADPHEYSLNSYYFDARSTGRVPEKQQ